jgi:hypothetical protein
MICFIVRRENIDFVITLKEDPSADCHYSEGQAKKNRILLLEPKTFPISLPGFITFYSPSKLFFLKK